jgi:hypothetical protein
MTSRYSLLGIMRCLTCLAAASMLEPVAGADGLRLGVKIEPPSYFLGERVPLTLVVGNAGSQTEQVMEWPNCMNVDIEVFDAHGRGVGKPLDASPILSALVVPVSIAPGQRIMWKIWLTDRCRFTEPGTYRVEVTLDGAAGRTQVCLIQPSPAVAQRIIGELEQGAIPADLSTIASPVFLAPLMARAREGDLSAANGIGGITTVEATQALIDLGKSASGAARIGVAQQLIKRIRPWSIADLRRCYRPKMAPEIRNLAREWLKDDDTSLAGCAAETLGYVGARDDVPRLVAIIRECLTRWPKADYSSVSFPLSNDEDRASYLTSASDEAIRELSKRGVPVASRQVEDGADAYAYFSLYWSEPAPRPVRWEQLMTRYRNDSAAAVRAAAVQSIPKPPPAKYEGWLETAARDSSPLVRRAARSIIDADAALTQRPDTMTCSTPEARVAGISPECLRPKPVSAFP